MKLKHWTHTEYIDLLEYNKFYDHQVPVTAVLNIPNNTGVLLEPIGGGRQLEGIYNSTECAIRPLRYRMKREPNRDLRLYVDALLSDDITVIAVDGLMGTGKTSTAVEELTVLNFPDKVTRLENGTYVKEKDTKILLAKPNVSAGGEEYGFLPGDIDEKLEPCLLSYKQYFDDFHDDGYNVLREVGYIETLPLGYIRGLNAKDMTVIVDECQNTKELVSVVTRKARNSRVLLLGDTSPFQIDRVGNTTEKNGLTSIIDLLKGADYFQYVELKTLNHVVRSQETRDVVRRLFNTYGENINEWS